MRGLSFNIFRGFHTEDEMIDYFKTKAFNNNATVLAGTNVITFQNLLSNRDYLILILIP